MEGEKVVMEPIREDLCEKGRKADAMMMMRRKREMQLEAAMLEERVRKRLDLHDFLAEYPLEKARMMMQLEEKKRLYKWFDLDADPFKIDDFLQEKARMTMMKLEDKKRVYRWFDLDADPFKINDFLADNLNP